MNGQQGLGEQKRLSRMPLFELKSEREHTKRKAREVMSSSSEQERKSDAGGNEEENERKKGKERE